mmetsp:Transcript_52296/g.121602  ORF Transcript_52296/g.121602 Transcript_52296/m.121602 type:complete len:200 (+) Transcript_52296:882-1481(+)
MRFPRLRTPSWLHLVPLPPSKRRLRQPTWRVVPSELLLGAGVCPRSRDTKGPTCRRCGGPRASFRRGPCVVAVGRVYHGRRRGTSAGQNPPVRWASPRRYARLPHAAAGIGTTAKCIVVATRQSLTRGTASCLRHPLLPQRTAPLGAKHHPAARHGHNRGTSQAAAEVPPLVWRPNGPSGGVAMAPRLARPRPWVSPLR